MLVLFHLLSNNLRQNGTSSLESSDASRCATLCTFAEQVVRMTEHQACLRR
jgi:hypothetical protein